jgi:cephalosporin hydroxylase
VGLGHLMGLAEDYARVCATPSDIYLHLPRMVALVEELDATSVIELGTRTGVSTIAWLYALEGRGHLTSVDLDGRPPIGEHPHWTFIQGDDLSMKVLERMKPADIVFLDTSHLYDHTIVELEVYRVLVKPGGRIVCHDTQLRRPEGSPSRPLFPVRTAILEFVEREGLDWHEYPDCWGLGVIVIPDDVKAA